MSNPELLAKLQQLSHDEKIEIINFLTAELVKDKILKSLDNSATCRAWSPYDYGDAARKLMGLLEKDQGE